jgi:16S rRNA (cytosine967-C5)-methyltransferase
MDGPAFEAWLDGKGMKWQRGAVEDAYVVEDAGSLAADEGYRRGDFSIQGQSAMLAAQAVEAKPGMQILDACAAPGGKTCLMPERMNGSGRVYAWDVHPHRVELIRAAAKRLGLDNVRPSEHDARKPLESFDLMMDAVLVDAPCSGLGVLRRRAEARWTKTETGLREFPALQQKILDNASRYVKPGGVLVYSTCTIEDRENRILIETFLQNHREWKQTGFAHPRTKKTVKELQLYPQRDGVDGFYLTLLQKDK